MSISYYSSPIGLLKLTADQRKLRAMQLVSAQQEPAQGNMVTQAVEEQLTQYFSRARTSFDFAMLPHGTPFQTAVWSMLTCVPYGKVVTYGQLAAAIGQPTACRAVANAVGANPLLIFIPCHRVVAADSIGGFSAGLPAKRTLLHLEGILSEESGCISKNFFFTFP